MNHDTNIHCIIWYWIISYFMILYYIVLCYIIFNYLLYYIISYINRDCRKLQMLKKKEFNANKVRYQDNLRHSIISNILFIQKKWKSINRLMNAVSTTHKCVCMYVQYGAALFFWLKYTDLVQRILRIIIISFKWKPVRDPFRGNL